MRLCGKVVLTQENDQPCFLFPPASSSNTAYIHQLKEATRHCLRLVLEVETPVTTQLGMALTVVTGVESQRHQSCLLPTSLPYCGFGRTNKPKSEPLKNPMSPMSPLHRFKSPFYYNFPTPLCRNSCYLATKLAVLSTIFLTSGGG